MKNINIIFICSLLFILIVSCSQKSSIINQAIGTPKTIKPEIVESILTSSFLDSISYISLDSKDLIGKVSDLIFKNNRYYISDGISRTISVFDSNGNSLFEINAMGRGPGEYTEIADFYVTNSYILILCRTLKKIIRYSLEGKPLDETAINDYIEGIRPLESEYLTYAREGDERNIYGRAPGISKLEISTAKTVNTVLQVFGGNYSQYASNQFVYFTEGSNNSYLLLNPSDIIFSYSKDTLRSKYLLDFGDMRILDEHKRLKSSPANFDILQKKGYVTYKDFLIETTNFVFLTFVAGSPSTVKYLFYDSSSSKSVYSSVLSNDLKGYMPYTFPTFKKEKDQVVSILNPEVFKNYLAGFESNKQVIIKALGEFEFNKQIKKLKKLAESNNPVLAVGYLKASI